MCVACEIENRILLSGVLSKNKRLIWHLIHMLILGKLFADMTLLKYLVYRGFIVIIIAGSLSM